MAEEMFDREAIQAALDEPDDGVSEAETLDVLNELIQEQSTMRWLDESVPALGGLTPRQAVEDPTRREQVERLLAEFEDTSRFDALPEGFTPMSYDVDLLRRELGLG